MSNFKILEAIKSINPNSETVIRGSDIDTCEIEWHNGTAEISKADIKAKIAELQAEYDALEWKRNRQKEYPNHEDCIHALLDGGDTLTDLQTKRTTVKDKYPKE
jgi:hypothetical protein